MALVSLLLAACIILTGSRTGQVVVVAALASYFISRVGLRGAIAGGILAIPLLLYGGRESLGASASSVERIECWYEGLSLFRSYPFAGVGHGQFTEHHYLTAHNAYLLALSELGIVGLFLFGAVLYLAFKIPLMALRRYPDQPGDWRRSWAIALIATMSGLTIGSFFLSFTYHFVLWVFVGLSGAFYGVLKNDDRGFSVELRMADYALILSMMVALIAALYVYTSLALG
jgi:O-antigen ligase